MTALNREKVSIPNNSKVLIVHGAIRRSVTKVWMEAFRSYLSTRGISAECFYWSGIPAGFATRAASRKLVARLKEIRAQRLVIWCKSTGADVVNLAVAHTRPNLIVQVAPVFAASTTLVPEVRRVTVRLAHDSFLNFWERMRIVHPIADIGLEHLIVGPADLHHHDLNYNREAVLSTQQHVHLYGLYANILAEGLRIAD